MMNQRPEVDVHMIGRIRNPLLEVGGPVSYWIGPETLVDLTIEGRNVNALVDSGSQVNTITPALVQPWTTARMVQLLSCRKSTAVLTLGGVEAQSEGASRGPQDVDMDELGMVRESVHLGPFQTKIIVGWVKPLLGDTAHNMITPLRAKGQLWGARPLPLGLHVLHAYTGLKNGSGKASLMVRNVSDSHIFLKKGVPVARVVSASPVPPTELLLEMEAALGMEF